jgi:Flp pilus assembly protein TadD
MSDTAAVTPPRATPHFYEPIRALLQAGKNDEAIVKLCALVVMRPQDWAAKHLLFDAFFQKREWAPALALIEELNRQRPDDARLQKALVVTLSNMKRYRGDCAGAPSHCALRRGSDDHRRSQGRAFLHRQDHRGGKLWPARSRTARRRSLRAAGGRQADRTCMAAFRGGMSSRFRSGARRRFTATAP